MKPRPPVRGGGEAEPAFQNLPALAGLGEPAAGNVGGPTDAQAGSPAGREALIAAAVIPEAAALLPDSVLELAEEIGLAATLRLVAARGGTTVHVPKLEPRTRLVGHRLAGELGFPNLAALAAARGGEKIQVPRCSAARRELRNLRIVEEAAAGAGVNQLALRWGTSERSVRRLIARARPEAGGRTCDPQLP